MVFPTVTIVEYFQAWRLKCLPALGLLTNQWIKNNTKKTLIYHYILKNCCIFELSKRKRNTGE